MVVVLEHLKIKTRLTIEKFASVTLGGERNPQKKLVESKIVKPRRSREQKEGREACGREKN